MKADKNQMKKNIATLILFAGICQAGVITGGSLLFAGHEESANLSGPDFSATIADFDVGPFPDGGIAPFSPFIPTGIWNEGIDGGDGVSFQGVWYAAPSVNGIFPGEPYSEGMWYSLTLLSAPVVITEPGIFTESFSLQAGFCLYNSNGVERGCETESGTVLGSFTATPGPSGFDSWMFVSGMNGSVEPTVMGFEDLALSPSPEPATFAVVGFSSAWLLYRMRRRFGRRDQ